jgi:hypothetical protein
VWAQLLFSFSFVSVGTSGVACPFPRTSIGRLLTDLFQPVAFVVVLIVLFILAQAIHGVIFVVQRVLRRSRAPSEGSVEATHSPTEAGSATPGSPIELQETRVLDMKPS